MPPEEKSQILGIAVPRRGIFPKKDASTIIGYLRNVTHGSENPGETLATHFRQLGFQPEGVYQLKQRLVTTVRRNFRSMPRRDFDDVIKNLSSAEKALKAPR